MKKLIVALFLFAPLFVQADILEVRARWNAFKCLDACTPLLENNFSSIRGVNSVNIDSRAGIAIMAFAKGQPFDYTNFRYAAAAAGIQQLLDVRVRVKGTIRHEGDAFFLLSTGDGTVFTLLSPVNPIPGGNTPNSIETHFLTPSLINQLLDAERRQETLLISGPLFFPNKYTNYLILESMEKVKKNPSQR